VQLRRASVEGVVREETIGMPDEVSPKPERTTGEFHIGQRLTDQQARAIQQLWTRVATGEQWRQWHAMGSPKGRSCHRCGAWFVGSRARGRGLWRQWALRCAPCKAQTQAARRARDTNRARTQRRAAERNGRRCATCQTPLMLARRTKRFCSSRCRHAAWRNAKGSRHAYFASSTGVTGEER
jgi:hypothetical protein